MPSRINRPLLIIITLLVLCILGYLLYRNFRQPENPQSQFYTSNTESQPPITFQLSQQPIIPSKLPVYQTSSMPYSATQITKIAQELEFTQEPFVAPDDGYQGETWTYSGNGAVLRILPQVRVIDYKKLSDSQTSPFTQYPDKELLYQQGIQYLQRHNFISNPQELVPYQQMPQSAAEDGIVRPTQPAIYIRVSYLKTIDNYPLYAQTYDTGIVSLNFNSDLQVTSVYIDDLPQLTNPEDISLKSFSAIQQTATTKSTIQHLSNDNIDPYEIYSLPIEEIIITNLELAYVQQYEAQAQELQPTFILKGTAQFQEIDQTASVVLYLPAIAQ